MVVLAVLVTGTIGLNPALGNIVCVFCNFHSRVLLPSFTFLGWLQANVFSGLVSFKIKWDNRLLQGHTNNSTGRLESGSDEPVRVIHIQEFLIQLHKWILWVYVHFRQRLLRFLCSGFPAWSLMYKIWFSGLSCLERWNFTDVSVNIATAIFRVNENDNFSDCRNVEKLSIFYINYSSKPKFYIIFQNLNEIIG
jgi:hypothetical protein